MSRISLLVALAVMGSAVGCAQCDTCDDFPVPCVGPNCGQLAPGGIPGIMPGGMGPGAPGSGSPVMGSSTPMMGDGAGPAPSMPAPTLSPMAPPVDPTSPPDHPSRPDGAGGWSAELS